MIGQQKRSLEHSVSPQPSKYQKHFDDSCETSSKVASPTAVQLDLEEHFSGVQPKQVLSPAATGVDSVRFGEEANELGLTDQTRKQNVRSNIDHRGTFNSFHELDSLSYPSAGLGACESSVLTRSQICWEAKVDHLKESGAFSADFGSHTQDSVDLFCADNLVPAGLHSAEDLSSNYGKRDREGSVVNALKETASKSGGIECGISHQKGEGTSGANANEMGVEDERAFLESGRKPVESRRSNGSRPLPVFLSGKVINLYLMNEQVKAHGGYQSVTSEGLWGKISQTLGFVPECGPGVKLIYFKYLKHFERETSQSLEAQLDATSLDVAQTRIGGSAIESRLDDEKGEKFSPLVGEQFAESEPFLEKSETTTINVDDSGKTGVSHHGSNHFEDQAEMQISRKERETDRAHSYQRVGGGQGCQRSQSGSAPRGEVWEGTQAQSSDRHLRKMYSDISGAGMSKMEYETEDDRNIEESQRAVSRQPLTSTLIWIKRMALDPGNPHMGEGVEGAGQNEEWVKMCASEAEKIRGVFWKRKEEIRVGEAHLHQAKQLPTPSHYYEEFPRPDQQSIERFRATRERVAQYGYPGSPGLHRSFHEPSHYLQRGPSPHQQNQNHWSCYRVPRQSSFHSSYIEIAYPDYGFTDRPRKRVPIGPDFQAYVPCRESLNTKSASGRAAILGDEAQRSDEDEDEEESVRWFGKQVWPPPGFREPFPYVPVGVGRALTCACLYPGSMDCVRIHVQEERVRLERELGQAFYIWKFDEMGESVADTWTKEEERTFRTIVKINPPSLDKNFWEQLPDAFPGKKMRELVSYYFNVFVLRRRAVQNRLEGRRVDSDDDETELPEDDSDDSEEYDSGEEPEEDGEEDTSDAGYETDQHDSYGGGGSGKLMDHTGFCDLGGLNLVYCPTNIDAIDTDVGADNVSIDICPSSGLDLETEDQVFRSPRRETLERNVRLDSAELTTNWNHEQDEKHVETHVNFIGEKELQEVKTWEDPHWDEADHGRDVVEEDAHVEAPLSGQADKRQVSPDRKNSGHKGEGVGDDHRNTIASCEPEVWVEEMDSAPRREGDKLLSTNGMIQELFGDESPEANSPS